MTAHTKTATRLISSLLLVLIVAAMPQQTTIYQTTQITTGQNISSSITGETSPPILSSTSIPIPTLAYWAKTYGGSGDDKAQSVQQTTDGGYVVAGYTASFGAGCDDVWVLKLNSTGGVTWQKTYGGSGDDEAYSVQRTSDGGYIVAGATSSFGAGWYNFWVLKLGSTGSVEWQKTYGDWGVAYSVQQTPDDGYIAAGKTVSFGAGGSDVWVLKLYANGSLDWQKAYGGTSTDYAYSVQQTSDGRYIVAGETNSFGAGAYDFWVLRLDSGGSVVWNEDSGASTYMTRATPWGSSAAVSATSVTDVDSAGIVQDTHVTPQDTSATVMVQAGPEAIPLAVIAVILAVAVGAVVIIMAISVYLNNRPTGRGRRLRRAS